MPTFASSSKPPPAARPKASGSGAYTSAADLGYVPQPEAGPSSRDETVGQAGEWEVVAPLPELLPPPQVEGDAAVAEGDAALLATRPPPRKREFGSTADDADDPEEPRSFKFKRRERQAFFDDDDDLPEIKLKRPSGSAAAVKLEPLAAFRGVEWGSRLPAEGAATLPAPEADVEVGSGAQAEDEAEDIKPTAEIKEEPVALALPPPEGGGMFKKRRGPPKGVGKRPNV